MSTEKTPGKPGTDSADAVSTTGSLVEQIRCEISKQPGITMTSRAWRSTTGALKDEAEAFKIGFKATSTLLEINTGRIASVRYAREAAGVELLELTVAERENVESWDLDYMEIQKPVRTWKASQIGEDGLAHIKAWETLKNVPQYKDDWINFRYYPTQNATNPEPLQGLEKTLAQMIADGIDHYNVYTPVIIRKSHPETAPENTGSVGTVCTPTGDNSGPDDSLPGKYTALAASWLKVADTQQGSTDGTVTRTERWIGADAWNENLYGPGSTDSGGSDSGGSDSGGGDSGGGDSGGGDSGGGSKPDSGGGDSGGSDSGSGGLGPNPDLGKPDLGGNPDLGKPEL